MSARKTILQGTLILTAVGFLCRFMGFFYRIFLSHTFGEENVGLYQLTFPVFALCISFTSAGLETAISRTVARKQSLHQPREASETLCLGLFISCLLSVITMIILQKNAADLSTALLGDPRCEEILILLSYALPLSSIHGCIMGYCYGLKQTQIPAVSQLIEQTARILSVSACTASRYETDFMRTFPSQLRELHSENCFLPFILSEDFKRADLIFSARDFLSLL